MRLNVEQDGLNQTPIYRLRCHSKILPHFMSQNGPMFQPRPPTYYFEMGTSVACNSVQRWHTEEPKKMGERLLVPSYAPFQ
ncbi:hypothetical protein TNCV_3698511 [Trichonephila clavipes]|uniref:Uncharacterized protein n=1 Tax=Trichonephila clavipes TaxID=2585209 RepID=A0A8X6VEP8_TRICX|nr:hypothetical protein TNCV_3698511 [Trichonephila clavipes]